MSEQKMRNELDDEMREAHEEAVREWNLMREHGELDEGLDDYDSDNALDDFVMLPRSVDAGAMIRGLPGATNPQEEGTFVYTNCLYDDDKIREYEDTRAVFRRITFNISRYGEFSHTITFDEPLTEKGAIQEAEKWLSQPMTEAHYDTIKEDLFGCDEDWEEAKEFYVLRGDALGDCRFLETARAESDYLTLECGS